MPLLSIMIALTGSIGTGKSTVVKILQEHGVTVFDCDAYVKSLYEYDDVVNKVEQIFFTDGEKFSKKKLLQIISEDEEQRKALNNLIHPYVFAKLQGLAKGVVVDIPLLFETNAQNAFEQVIVVYCTREKQQQRLIVREGVDEEYTSRLIAMQIDIDLKKQQADIVIDNNGTVEDLEQEVSEKLSFLWR